jgi:hypothetical protein
MPIQEIKIATPDPYNGSSDKTEHFLHQCEVYFLGLPRLMDHQHVTFTISYMNKGCVLSWAERIVEEVTLPGYVTSWGEFKINVRMAFSDLDHVMMAQLKIKEVKQGKESMDDYIIQFEEFKGLMGFNHAALAEAFKEGLAPQILSQYYSLEHVPMTLTYWKEKSRLFTCHLAELHQHQCHWNLCYTTKGVLLEASEVGGKSMVI